MICSIILVIFSCWHLLEKYPHYVSMNLFMTFCCIALKKKNRYNFRSLNMLKNIFKYIFSIFLYQIKEFVISAGRVIAYISVVCKLFQQFCHVFILLCCFETFSKVSMCGHYYCSLKTRNPNCLFLSAYTLNITTVILTKMKKQHGTVVWSIGLKANLCCLDLALLLVFHVGLAD